MENMVADVKKIVIYGGESSGKTTLGNALSDKLKCPFVPEYGRFLYQHKHSHLLLDDLVLIAATQRYMEDVVVEAAKKTGAKYIVCDTSPLTTLWYSQQMLGVVPGAIAQNVNESHYDYTVLCANDIPFVQDGTRIDSVFRQSGFDWYSKMLVGCEHLVVPGSIDDRVNLVCKTFELML